MNELEKPRQLFFSVSEIIIKAKKLAFRNNNSILLNAYWEIGKLIVENEQSGSAKAAYGKFVLKNLAKQLSVEFGQGFDERNLNNMRAFYLAFPIWNAVRTELSWTHYRIISRVEDEKLRLRYIQHSVEENWDTRTLQRNIKTQYIGRIIDHNITDQPAAQNKGFAFVSRQQHIVTDTADFYIDLVFYNYYLKCFVLVDLKTHKLTHQAHHLNLVYTKLNIFSLV
jgi:hypothetical protein